MSRKAAASRRTPQPIRLRDFGVRELALAREELRHRKVLATFSRSIFSWKREAIDVESIQRPID